MDRQVFALLLLKIVTESVYSSGDGETDKHSSWWPQLHQWKNSGLDVKYWGTFCESWYQTRLSKLLSGEITVKGGREWKQGMKMDNLTRNLIANNEAMSLQFLQSL